MSELTRVLDAMDHGDPAAADKLLPLVYGELRRLASHRMAGENPNQTLQPTALVHEAWLRLTGNEERRWNGRTHFFAAAAESMRRILVDNARRKQAQRHGGGKQRVDLNEIESLVPDDGHLIAVNEALEKFAILEPQKAELVKLRYFIGMTIEEAAEALGISVATAKRHWLYARAWLYEEVRAAQQ